MMQLGQEVYTIKEVGHPSWFEVQEHELTGLVRKTEKAFLDDNFEYYLDGVGEFYLTTKKITVNKFNYKYRLFTSKKKAENVARCLNEQREAFKKKLERERALEKENIEENKRWIDSIRQHIKNKDVMVKVGWQHQKWAKAKIGEIKPWPYEKHVFMFNAHGNKYISSREGKNWYFDIEYV